MRPLNPPSGRRIEVPEGVNLGGNKFRVTKIQLF